MHHPGQLFLSAGYAPASQTTGKHLPLKLVELLGASGHFYQLPVCLLGLALCVWCSNGLCHSRKIVCLCLKIVFETRSLPGLELSKSLDLESSSPS